MNKLNPDDKLWLEVYAGLDIPAQQRIDAMLTSCVAHGALGDERGLRAALTRYWWQAQHD